MSDSQPEQAADNGPEQNEVFAGQFELIGVIGQGANGTVYKCRQLMLDRTAALKILSGISIADERSRRRFRSELAALSNLSHANIVKAYGAGISEDGRAYICTELLEGESLAELLKRKVFLSGAEVLEIFLPVFDALSYAHGQSVVHRDLKPSNLIITKNGEPKLIDFGLAKVLSPEPETAQRATATGSVVGSPAYMSPEQASAAQIDARSDIYSLALMIFECLTGKAVFSAGSPLELMYMQIHSQPPRLELDSKQNLNRDALQQVMNKALQKAPQDRYQSVFEFQNALQKALHTDAGEQKTKSIFPRSPSKVLFAFVLLAACVAAFVTAKFILKADLSSAAQKSSSYTKVPQKRIVHKSNDPKELILSARKSRKTSGDLQSNPKLAVDYASSAIEDCDRALSLIPKDQPYLIYLAYVGRLKAMGRYELAKKWQSGKSPDLRKEKRDSLLAALRVCKPDWHLEKGLLFRELGAVELELNQKEKSLNYFKQAVAEKDREPTPDFAPEGQALDDGLDSDSAILERDYEFALIEAYRFLGCLTESMGKDDAASKYYKRSFQLCRNRGNYGTSHDENVARICTYLKFLYRKKQKEEFNSILKFLDTEIERTGGENPLKTAGRKGRCYCELGETCLILGETEKGKAFLSKAAQLFRACNDADGLARIQYFQNEFRLKIPEKDLKVT